MLDRLGAREDAYQVKHDETLLVLHMYMPV